MGLWRSGAWCVASLVVLSCLHTASAFYLPGVAPQDFAKVRVDVLEVMHSIHLVGGLSERSFTEMHVVSFWMC